MMLWHASPMHAAAGIPSKALLQSTMGYKCTAAEAGPVTASLSGEEGTQV